MRTVVIGAGIVGLAVADALARRGVEVHVLDRRPPGRGASQASAGILAPYTEAAPDSVLLAPGVRSLAMFEGFVADAAARSGRAVEFARPGTLEVATTESGAMHLRAHVERLRALDVHADWIDGARVAGVEPEAAACVGAALTASHAFVRVNDLMIALAHAARYAGATITTPVDVHRVSRRRGGGVSVHAHGRDPIDADVAVICTGSWSGRLRLDNAPRLPVRPVRGQLLALTWPTTRRRVAHIVWGGDAYCVPWSDGTLLVGATMEEAGFDERSTAAGVAGLLHAAMHLLPGAAEAAVTSVRVGLRPAAPDGLPIVGPLQGDAAVVLATAHYRNGILLAPLTAEAIARFVCDGERDDLLTVASPDRFIRPHR